MRHDSTPYFGDWYFDLTPPASKSATAYGTAMHKVGKNVTILQTGGSGVNGDGNLLTGLLRGLPGLAKELDIQSGVLNGTSFNDVLTDLVNAVKGNAPEVVAGEPGDELQS